MGRIILQEECEGALIWLSEALCVFLWNIFPACQTALAGNSMKPRWGIMDVSCIFLHNEGNSLWLLHRLRGSDWKCWGGRTDTLKGLIGTAEVDYVLPNNTIGDLAWGFLIYFLNILFSLIWIWEYLLKLSIVSDFESFTVKVFQRKGKSQGFFLERKVITWSPVFTKHFL